MSFKSILADLLDIAVEWYKRKFTKKKEIEDAKNNPGDHFDGKFGGVQYDPNEQSFTAETKRRENPDR